MQINKAIRQMMKEKGVSLLVMAKAGLAFEKRPERKKYCKAKD